jgi:NAD-dependent SIR2 family protein deacetylase
VENRLDGNAAAGALQAIFPFEMTMAEATCVGCGRTTVMAELMVYKHGMGTIMRCPACDTALIRMAESKGRYWLDVRGVRVMQIPVES